MNNKKNIIKRIINWVADNKCLSFIIACFIAMCVIAIIVAPERARNKIEIPEPIPVLAETKNDTETKETVAYTDEATTTEYKKEITVINEWCDDELFAQTKTDNFDIAVIDNIIMAWDESGYDYLGEHDAYYEAEYDSLYEVVEINLYFEERIVYIANEYSYNEPVEYYSDGEWIYINEPYQTNSLYEGVFCITDTSSPQWNWLQTHDYYFNEEGIGIYDGRIMVALTPSFGGIGDYVDFLMSDGTILYCVICDFKGNAGTWGHWHGDYLNVIEIMVDEWWYDCGHGNKYYPDVVAFK